MAAPPASEVPVPPASEVPVASLVAVLSSVAVSLSDDDPQAANVRDAAQAKPIARFDIFMLSPWMPDTRPWKHVFRGNTAPQWKLCGNLTELP